MLRVPWPKSLTRCMSECTGKLFLLCMHVCKVELVSKQEHEPGRH